MTQTPLSERLRLVLFGKRNAGKSSLINNIAGKPIAIVSQYPGTTTDPVSFPMELGELGPVVFVDTAGIDDEGELGLLRIQKTKERSSTCGCGNIRNTCFRSSYLIRRVNTFSFSKNQSSLVDCFYFL